MAKPNIGAYIACQWMLGYKGSSYATQGGDIEIEVSNLSSSQESGVLDTVG